MAAESVTRGEPLVHVAVPLLVLGLPMTRMVSPAAATAAAEERVFLRNAKVLPLLASEPLLRSTNLLAICITF